MTLLLGVCSFFGVSVLSIGLIIVLIAGNNFKEVKVIGIVVFSVGLFAMVGGIVNAINSSAPQNPVDLIAKTHNLEILNKSKFSESISMLEDFEAIELAYEAQNKTYVEDVFVKKDRTDDTITSECSKPQNDSLHLW